MARTNTKLYIEAYDSSDLQILGTLDGQGTIQSYYKNTARYKALSTFKTLNGRVLYYKIVNKKGTLIEIVQNYTHLLNLSKLPTMYRYNRKGGDKSNG